MRVRGGVEGLGSRARGPVIGNGEQDAWEGGWKRAMVRVQREPRDWAVRAGTRGYASGLQVGGRRLPERARYIYTMPTTAEMV